LRRPCSLFHINKPSIGVSVPAKHCRRDQENSPRRQNNVDKLGKMIHHVPNLAFAAVFRILRPNFGPDFQPDFAQTSGRTCNRTCDRCRPPANQLTSRSGCKIIIIRHADNNRKKALMQNNTDRLKPPAHASGSGVITSIYRRYR
jgi:hypothetical protein